MAKGLFNEGDSKAISLDDLNDGLSAEELSSQAAPEQVTEPVEKPEDQPEAGKEQETRVEAKPTETQAEPTEETPKETETKPTEAEKPKEEEPAGQFDFSFLNKTLNTNYESLDQIKADINKPTMESEYEGVKTQLEEWQSKYNELNETYELLTEQIDPSNYFSSDEAMKLEAFKKENPDKDPSIAQKVFSTEDLTSINDLDMVKMGWRFNTPTLKGTDKDLETAIAEELNQDPDTPISEWPVSAQNRLARMAGQYSDQFKHIKNSVSLPEKIDIEALKTQRKQEREARETALTDGWGQVAEETLKSTESVKVPIGKPAEGEEQKFFVWELGSPPEEEVSTLKERFISMGIDPKENKDSFQETLNLALFQKNAPMILQKYGEDLLAQNEEKHLEETHNPNPLKDSERTTMSEKDKEKEEQTRFAREDVVPRFRSNPLFIKK